MQKEGLRSRRASDMLSKMLNLKRSIVGGKMYLFRRCDVKVSVIDYSHTEISW